MKKLIALVVLLCGFMPVLWAADGCDQHLSREDFRNKQKAFIIEQAGLTKELSLIHISEPTRRS